MFLGSRPALISSPPAASESVRTQSEGGTKATAECMPNPQKPRTEGGGDPARKPKQWWRHLKELDPITLASLSELAYPPFELLQGQGVTGVKIYFDPAALRDYFLASGNFTHPVTRAPVTRAECARLDSHLARNGLAAGVAAAHDSVAHHSATQAHLPVTLRREAGVLANRLFEFPTLRQIQQQQQQQHQQQQQLSRRDDVRQVQQGATTLVDDDVWEPVPLEARSEEFPPLAPRSTPPPSFMAARAPAPPSLPPPPRVAPRERAPLVLAPRSIGEAPAALPASRPTSVFGAARPREDVLSAKGAPLTSGSSDQGLDASLDAPDELELCPYPPHMLRLAKDIGFSWVSIVERKLAHFRLADQRSLALDPMSPSRRKLVSELCSKHWNFAVQEMDPEPNRFLELSLTPFSARPSLTLTSALVRFSSSFNLLLELPSNSCYGILFLGATAQHGRPVDVSDVRAGLSGLARDSEYEVTIFDFEAHNDGGSVLVEFSVADRARRVLKTLKEGTRPVVMDWKRMQWWVAGASYAQAQVALKLAKLDAISEAKHREREQKLARERNAKAKDAWDVEDGENSEETKAAAFIKLQPQQARHQFAAASQNAFEALNDDDDDDDDEEEEDHNDE